MKHAFSHTTLHPTALIILDGWGYSKHKHGNAIAQAHTPVWDRLWTQCPHRLLDASGKAVGLPDGQIGNSEVGHLHIGAGCSVQQDLTRIHESIACGDFFKHKLLIDVLQHVQSTSTRLHVIGLLSPGGVHSHEQHLWALLQLAARCGLHHHQLCLHAILDGRDTPPRSAQPSITILEHMMHELQCGHIGSIMGRYYAMDRDQRWQRTQKAYALLTGDTTGYSAKIHEASCAQEALEQAYARDESDEFITPTRLAPHTHPMLQPGDSLLFMNFRPDRMRQITQALTASSCPGVVRSKTPSLAHKITLTQYHPDLPVKILFPPERLDHTLGACVAEAGLTQLRLAETEKYAHVTFFMNGRHETPFERETRQLIPSPQVDTYDQSPAMSAIPLTEALIKGMAAQHTLIVCNYANADMVGHTGNLKATIEAICVLDQCLGQLLKAAQRHHYDIVITADHGNAECMYDAQHHQRHTAHTTAPVPLVYCGNRSCTLSAQRGTLKDVAPFVLKTIGLTPPPQMLP